MPAFIPPPPSQAQVASEFVASLFAGSNQVLQGFAFAVAGFIKRVWEPSGTSTALILAEMGTEGAKVFQESADAVAYLWQRDARRSEFLAACESVGLEVQTVDGLPVFPAILPVTIAQDGTVTLTEA